MCESIGDFDGIATRYDGLLSNALGIFGGENSYYSFRKVEIVANLVGITKLNRILDFGCGNGSLIRHLLATFPDTEIWGTDSSSLSLEIAKRDNPNMKSVSDKDIPVGYFELIIISNVLHHVHESDRVSLLDKISNCLVRDGKLVIFEHNRLNPITRKIVNRCEFDEGVELLSRRSGTKLMEHIGKFEIQDFGYFLFVPPFLKKLRKIETILKKVPIGAQFWLSFRRIK